VCLEKDFFFPLRMAEKAGTALYLAEQTEPGRPLARVTGSQSRRGAAHVLKYMDSSLRWGGPAPGRGLLCGSDGVHGGAVFPHVLRGWSDELGGGGVTPM